jgi:hypothetical protein
MPLSETLRKIQPVPKYFPTASVLISALQFAGESSRRFGRNKGAVILMQVFKRSNPL